MGVYVGIQKVYRGGEYLKKKSKTGVWYILLFYLSMQAPGEEEEEEEKKEK